MQRRRRLVTSLTSLVVVLSLLPACTENQPNRDASTSDDPAPVPAGANDPVRRACRMDDDMIVRSWRGIDPERSEDIIIVPEEPNYQGTFNRTSHTGPWDYVQEVPLVFYGPDIPDRGLVNRHATLADVYPTLGRLLGIDFPARDGRVLPEVLSREPLRPKVIVAIMWDGGGNNVLQRWPDAWPNLKRLMGEGVAYRDATVGSSPSVTPPAHANLATGAFPRANGISGIHLRLDGEVHRVFEGADPTDMELTTFADEIDLHFDNEPKVGLLAWQVAVIETDDPEQTSNHISMLGSGSAIEGGDKDEMALIGHRGHMLSNDEYFTMPEYLVDFPTLQLRIDELDEGDGQQDGRWRGHDIAASHDNPAWVHFQMDMIDAMFHRSGYGKDDVPDVFTTNFKPSDLAGHHFQMDSPEMRDVIEAQDAALGDFVQLLDDEVGDYVLILSADHGHTPSPENTGAWALDRRELERDIDAAFEVPEGQTMIQCCSVAGIFLDRAVMDELSVTHADVARFVNGYRIRDNWNGDLPPGFEDRGAERIFSAAFPKGKIDEVMECAFGRETPPPDIDA